MNRNAAQLGGSSDLHSCNLDFNKASIDTHNVSGTNVMAIITRLSEGTKLKTKQPYSHADSHELNAPEVIFSQRETRCDVLMRTYVCLWGCSAIKRQKVQDSIIHYHFTTDRGGHLPHPNRVSEVLKG